MTLVKWDPFSELTDFHRAVDRLFGGRHLPKIDDGFHGRFAPSVDVYETDKEIVVEAEIPGAAEKDISVEVKDNILTLSGERKKESEAKYDDYHRIERTYGRFQRSFTLPDSIETEKVKAKVKNGVLTVRLPKVPKAVAKKIAVSVE